MISRLPNGSENLLDGIHGRKTLRVVSAEVPGSVEPSGFVVAEIEDLIS
jgi:hypothetical protein